ncbi:MAG: PDZ domain-containing protein [Firmicutes bacterium]|nr:PDZ domain-containing protein [Bacillota bacterium]
MAATQPSPETAPAPGQDLQAPGAGAVRRGLWTRPRCRQILVAAGLVAVAGVLGWFIPTPYVVTAPGTAYDAAGMVRVPGAVDPEHPGRFLVLTVTSRQANLYWYLYGRLYPWRVRLQPLDEALGAYPDYQQYEADAAALMAESRLYAAAAALRLLGYPVRVEPRGARVVALTTDSPSGGLLQPGDRIVAVAGQPVPGVRELMAALRQHPPGQPLPVTVERGGGRLERTVPTGRHRSGEGAALGILVRDAFAVELPLAVEVEPGGITGPSAGLIFSLEIVEQLTGEPLAGDLRVAGTGAVDPEGRVGPVGGVPQKVYTAEAAGARVLFVPRENYAEARAVATRVEVVAVGSVEEAVAWLRAHRSEVPGTGSAGRG